jgi:nucleotide-binding universal stress UspA family protein
MPKREDSRFEKIKTADQVTQQAAYEILSGAKKKRFGQLMPFLGPAFIASVAYVDPGNFATNIQAGSKYGYLLLWVIVASNLMAMLIQAMSAKLGIATGKNLAEHCRLHYSRPVVIGMWVLMELVAMATDLAEFLGAALGFNLLLGIPLIVGGFLTAVATFLILGLERYGFRPLEAVITSMVGVIATCYLIETILDKPHWGNVFYHAMVPRFAGGESVLLATGILGATVMPHAIFLHSALTQGRIKVTGSSRLRRLFRFEIASRFLPEEAHVTRHVHTAPVRDVAKSIVDHESEFPHDLIVMCSHGRGRATHLLLGSIAQKVIAMGKIPVIITKSHMKKAAPPFSCDSMTIPLDGVPEHEKLLPQITELAKVCGARLYLITVISTYGSLSGRWTTTSRLLPGTTSTMFEMHVENAEAYLAELKSDLEKKGIAVSTSVLRGDPAHIIWEFARQMGTDLIVMATHRKSGMDALFSGSVASKLYSLCTIPMLLMPIHEEKTDSMRDHR